MKSALTYNTKTIKKVKVESADGENSQAAKEDRLRISSFQAFWKTTLQNVYLLNYLKEPKVDHSHEIHRLIDNKKLPENSWLIHPSDPIKVGWDFFVGLIIFYSILVVPYRIGFEIHTTLTDDIVEYVIGFIFFVDICVSFNSAYISSATDKLIVDRKVISGNYLKFWFWVDTVSTIPFDLLTHGGGASSIRLVKVLRLVRLFKLFRIIKLSKFAKRFDDIHINPSILNVLKLTFQIVFIAHLVACFWYFITTESVTGYVVPVEHTVPQSEQPVSWVTYLEMRYLPVHDLYVASFYWTVTTMLSIGYGEIIPTNNVERVYAMSVMMIGGVLFGAVIAQVTKFIESRNPQAKAFKARMDELKAYLTEKSPGETLLRREIISAYNYYLMKKSTFAESGIFDDLPKGMLVKLVHTIYEKEIAEVESFRKYNPRFVVHLVINSHPFQAREHEVVATQTDVAEEIVFIANGRVRLSVARGMHDNILVGYATDGDYFGDFEYVKRCARLATYTAVCGCNLLAIDYSILNTLEGEHSDAYDSFMETLRQRYCNFLEVKKLPYTRKRSTDVLLEFSSILMNGIIQDSSNAEMSQKHADAYAHMLKYRVLVEGENHKIKLDEMTAAQLYEMRILHPKFTEKVAWDMFIGILIVISVISAPVQIAFAVDSDDVSDWFFTTCFFFDMMFSFRTAYLSEEDDAYVVLPHMIRDNYYRTWFGIDLVSTVPFDKIVGLFMQGTSNLSAIKLVKSVRLLRLMRLLRLSKIRAYLLKLEDTFGIPPALFNIISMYIQVLFIAHLVACFWYGLTSILTPSPWFKDVALSGDISQDGVAQRYIIALYWTLTTLATVGYGDITPVNTSERILCVFVMILGASVFGYIVANVSALMGQMDQAGAKIVERVSEVTEYLNEKNCPKSLAESIIKHFRHMFNQRSAFDEESILKRLPKKLKNKLLKVQRGEIMDAIPIFNYLSNTSVAMYVYGLLDPLYFEYGQFLLREGDIPHDVNFIITGCVHIYRKVLAKKDVNGKGKGRGRHMARQGSVIGLSTRSRSQTGELGHVTLSKRISTLKKGISSISSIGKVKMAADKLSATVKNRRSISNISLQPIVSSADLNRSSSIATISTHGEDNKANKDTGIWVDYNRYKFQARERSREFLGEAQKGSFIGHVALLKNTRHEASAIAYRACSCYVLSRADIGKITREHSHASMFLQDALAKSIHNMQISLGKSNMRSVRSNYLYNLRRGFLHVCEENRDNNGLPKVKERASSFDIKSMSFSPIKAAMNEVQSSDVSKNKYAPSPLTPHAWTANNKVHPDGEGSVGSVIYSDTPTQNTPNSSAPVKQNADISPRRARDSNPLPPSANGESARASMGTIFDDEKLYYDSEEDESELRKISKGARFKRVNSCPNFRTVFARLPWVPSKGATDAKVAEGINRTSSNASIMDNIYKSGTSDNSAGLDESAIKSSIMTVEEFHKPVSDDSSDDDDDSGAKCPPRFSAKNAEKAVAPSLEEIINAASKGNALTSPMVSGRDWETNNGGSDGYKSSLPPMIGGKHGKVIGTHREAVVRRRRDSFPSLLVDKKRHKSEIHTMI